MKFIVLQDNPEYYNIILPMLYQEWKEKYNKTNIYNVNDLHEFFKNRKLSKTWLLINKKKQFIGTFTITKKNGKLFLEDGFVIPSFRGKNIGNYILDASIKIAGTMSDTAYLYTEKKLLKWYQKNGFVIIETKNDNLYLLKRYIIKGDINVAIQCYILYGIIFIILIMLAVYYI